MTAPSAREWASGRIRCPVPARALAFGILGTALVAGCAEPVGGPLPLWTAANDEFWAAPWPGDHRRDADGTISLEDFPNPRQVTLLDNYLGHLEGLDGFGNNAPVWFPFAGPLDALALPTPEESIARGSAVMLVDIDARSPEWGRAVPIRWELNTVDSSYWPVNTLAVQPVFGFPLRPETTYAAFVTRDLADRNPAFAEVWDDANPLHRQFAPLADVLFLYGLAPDDVAVATVFTTGDPLDEMARIASFVRDDIGLPDLDRQLEQLEVFPNYTAWRTHYPSPVFTHGERPFTTTGGGFEFTEGGRPVLAGWDDMRLAVCTPADLGAPPPTGWPVVVFQHGTGGDYRGFCDSDAALEVANLLGPAGFVSLGIDQPLHGTRNGGEAQSDLANFNILNPDSGITNFRQGAIDAIYLTHALASAPTTFRTPEGVEIPIDPDRVLFMGHSQGGLTGALAAPFFGGDVPATMLSGAGGGLAITIVERKDVIDFAQLVKDWLQFEEDEEVTTFHPVVGLIQTAVEVTDPVNYSPYWFATRGDWAGHRPTDVLLTSGTLDEATPYRSAIAMAAAARLPLLDPAASSTEALALRGIVPTPGPLRDNTTGFDGSPRTAALSQWVDGSHWVVFERTAAANLYVDYLETAAEGRPAIWLE